MSININLFSIEPIIAWIGVWGIAETVINKYIDYNNYDMRILLYALIILIAYLIYHLRTTKKVLYVTTDDETRQNVHKQY